MSHPALAASAGAIPAPCLHVDAGHFREHRDDGRNALPPPEKPSAIDSVRPTKGQPCVQPIFMYKTQYQLPCFPLEASLCSRGAVRRNQGGWHE
jgi:hypothetical protein